MQTKDLIAAFYKAGLSEVEGMNKLQDAGIISDNAVYAKDVAASNIPKAIAFIEGLS